ncbi:MAG: glycosyltransferase [Butyrivibrio sp.]|nr:glycosyltransferase [Acetatifactor muris]MCM1559214.1 glycosyltransferase [Butyrivibrio sp.]
MRTPMFSIIVVSLNPGHKLADTVKSVAEQSYTDYEVIVKDGGSKDGALEALREYLSGQGSPAQRAASGGGKADTADAAAPEKLSTVRILEQADEGIYDGMNQAARAARGEYLYFLNCGDTFASVTALEQAAGEIRRHLETDPSAGRIFYGDIFDAMRRQVVSSNPHIDAFACYRNVPCHQACIYHYSLFSGRGYETKYRVRADYEHFLWCCFAENVKPQYIPVTLASYEGGGFSETPENRKCSAREHREITARYFSRGQLLRYRLIMLLTLQPLRTKMAESPSLSGIYNACRRLLYRKRPGR